MASIFVIHGRDLGARKQMVKLIQSLGLEARLFEDVANRLGSAPHITEIVLKGIREADAVIALFTPDEQATLYDPMTGDYQGDREKRWQARPNVIFEAGLAFGLANALKKPDPILVTVGSDVELCSDIRGLHYLDLTRERAKKDLRERLEEIVGKLSPRENWLKSSVSGKFQPRPRHPWTYYDELTELESQLSQRVEELSDITLFDIVLYVAQQNADVDWEQWYCDEFMQEVEKLFDADTADVAYWYLIIYGFLAFNDIDQWWNSGDGSWEDSADYAYITPRGIHLLFKLQEP